ncbi:MAG: type II 3-dehydroquinate dehydratase [Chloroflexi bacterium]|nr:type II 3-dehydroquinate dehydratase [Chloroflexota bacterium]MCH8194990.1 type II 3-dehydroquinate dehydratase [Chloroflexota bacterium]MCI0768736.1 type II 3-dehydroquinate dehydratase [Chloroflexota bacterium]
MRVLVIHGPNLNMLGRRDPELYGTQTLADINGLIEARAKDLDTQVECFQANGEGAIIDFIQANASGADAIIINPGAFGHYSYAIHDALLDSNVPIAEVHLSNVFSRDQWRRTSVISPIVRGVVSGFGWRGYVAALEMLVALVREKG